MNALHALLTGPLTVRVGWALVHFVWQGVLLAALLGVFLWFARRSSAGLRYAACCGALLLMATCPPVTFFLTSRPEPVAVAEPVAEPARTVVVSPAPWSPPPTVEPARAVAEPVPVAAVPARPWWESGRYAVERHLGQAVAVWLAGVLLLSMRLLVGWRRVRRLRRSARPGGCAAWGETVGRVAHRLGVRRPVQVLESALAVAPAVVGWLKPVVLLPASALTGLTPEQLEAVLAHELAHVRRHDYAVNLVQTVVETLLFYHPAVHWVSWRIRCEREVCCDEMAVEACGDSLTYARALAELEGLRCAPGGAAVGLRGGSLLERIRHVAGLAPERGASASRWVAGLLGLALAACVAAGAYVGATHGAALPGGETNVHIVGLGGFETRFTFGGWELYWIPIGAEPTAPWLVLPYEGGEELEFVRRGPVVYASVDGGQQERIGVWVRGAEDLSAVSAAAGESAEPLAVWLDAPLLGELADLPERAGIGVLHLRGDERPSDLSPLSALANLTALYVGAAQDISDLGPLAALPRLSMLTLHPCEKVTDLGPLAELTEMRGLDLKGCRGVSDLGPLAGLTNLESLNLSGCRNVQDVSPLAHLGKLRFLAMSAGEAGDISALGSLTELRSLSLGCGSVEDVSPLAHLGRLRFLSISGDGVRDVSALSSLTELRSLRLGRTRNLSDLSPLAGLDNLAELDLSGVRQDPDLSVLAGLAGIRSLSLPSTTSEEDLEALLPTLPGLAELYLHRCERIGDLSPLAAAKGLTRLSLWNCDSISDLSPLAGLTSLSWLSLQQCDGVADLSPLADLPWLDYLDLRRCAPVSDLSPLRGMVGRGGQVSVDERLKDQLESLRAGAATDEGDKSAPPAPRAGLRLSLSAPEGAEYRSGRPLRLAAELRNVGPEPVPFSRLGRAGLRATDDGGGGLVVRRPVTVGPWEVRDGALAPGEAIRWDEWFDRLRFARPPEAGSTVRLRSRLPMRAEKADTPGGTPRLFVAFSDPVSVTVVDEHPTRLGPDDVPERWGSSLDFVYRGLPGIHIRGDGRTTLVGVPCGVLIPPGRVETVLERQELDALAVFLRGIRVWELADVKDDGISAVDETEIGISVACGGASLVRTFPWRMLAREPVLSALVTEVHRLMADIAARERPDFMPVGEAVEGVQVGLRAGMRRWQARETPRVTATVRNLGSRVFTFAASQRGFWQVEVDCTWYGWWPPRGGRLAKVFPHATGMEEVAVELTADWHTLPEDEIGPEAYDDDRAFVFDEAGRQPLELAPGTHVVRVACIGTVLGGTSPIRVVSNPVEIEVVPDEQFTFGLVVEQLVGDKSELRDCAIDLDAGVLHTLPEDFALHDGSALAWCQANGVDAFGELGTVARQGLSPVDTAFVPVEPETWDFSPDEVRGTVARAWPLPLRDPRAMTSPDKTPATFIFRTREGGTGVLQIVGFTEKPKGVRIRYKMVQTAGGATDEGESEPAAPGGTGALPAEQAADTLRDA